MITNKTISVASAFVAALLFQSAAAKSADDEKDKVTTRNATYTISRPKDSEEPKCVYRNEERLFCAPKYNYASFGSPVRTKSYDLIPLTTQPDGSGMRWWNYLLIVEQGEYSKVKTIVEGCFSDSCKIRATHVNYESDDVRFRVGRFEGTKIAVRFSAGVLSIRRRRIDPKEPLNAERCTRLFEALQQCSEPSSQSDCTSNYSSASQSTHFFFVGIENDYPGFSREKFDRACRAACIDKRPVGRQEVDQMFCQRR